MALLDNLDGDLFGVTDQPLLEDPGLDTEAEHLREKRTFSNELELRVPPLGRKTGSPETPPPGQDQGRRLKQMQDDLLSFEPGELMDLQGAQVVPIGDDPDGAARNIQLSRELGWPIWAVQEDPEGARNLLDRQRQEEKLKTAPVLLDRLKNDPEFNQVAHDDVDALSWWERDWLDVSGFLRDLEIGVDRQITGAVEGFETGLLQHEIGLIGDEMRRGTATQKQLADLETFQKRTRELRGFPGGFESALLVRRIFKLSQLSQEGELTELQAQALGEHQSRLRELLAQPRPDEAYSAPAGRVLGQMLPDIPEIIGTSIASGIGAGSAAALQGRDTPRKLWNIGTAFVAGAMAGGAAGIAVTSQRQEGAHAYLEMKEAGIPDDVAVPTSHLVGMASGLLETLGVKFVTAPFRSPAVRKLFANKVQEHLKNPTTAQALRSSLDLYLRGIAGESGTEVMQEVVQILGQDAALLLSDMETQLETPEGREQAVDQLLDVLIEIGQAQSLLGLPGTGTQLMAELKNVENAEAAMEALNALGENAKESKLAERFPEYYQEYIDEAVKDGPVQNMYIRAEDWRDYFERQGIDPVEAAREVPSVARQYEAAVEANLDIEIPLGEFAARIARSDHLEGLLPFSRMRKEMLPPAEARARAQNLDAIRAEGARVLADQAGNQEFLDSASQVREAMRQQILDAGVYDANQADYYAALTEVFYAVIAHNQGRQPMDVFREYELQIHRGEDLPTRGQTEVLEQERTRQHIDELMNDPNFQQFFEGSQVVDAEGRPQVVFHGTAGDIEAFDPARQGEEFGHRGGGFFFTNVPVSESGDSASDFARVAGRREGGANVVPAVLNLQNPLDVLEAPEVQDELNLPPEDPLDGMSPSDFWARHGAALRQIAEDLGHDGIIIRNPRSVSEPQETHFVAFEPTQIKSIFNQGTFDAEDPRILFQDAPPADPAWHYSFLAESVRTLNPKKRGPKSAAQWKRIISPKEIPGLKQEEIEWTGLYEWLDYFGNRQAEVSQLESELQRLTADLAALEGREQVDPQQVSEAQERVNRQQRAVENAKKGRVEWEDIIDFLNSGGVQVLDVAAGTFNSRQSPLFKQPGGGPAAQAETMTPEQARADAQVAERIRERQIELIEAEPEFFVNVRADMDDRAGRARRRDREIFIEDRVVETRRGMIRDFARREAATPEDIELIEREELEQNGGSWHDRARERLSNEFTRNNPIEDYEDAVRETVHDQALGAALENDTFFNEAYQEVMAELGYATAEQPFGIRAELDATRHDRWVLPGGAGYSELLLVVPEINTHSVKMAQQVRAKLDRLQFAPGTNRLVQEHPTWQSYLDRLKREHQQAAERWSAAQTRVKNLDRERGKLFAAGLTEADLTQEQKVEFQKAHGEEDDQRHVFQVHDQAWKEAENLLTDEEIAFYDADPERIAQTPVGGAVFPAVSAHWDVDNVVASVRMNERRGEDGGRVLFIEELQSDWAQAYRQSQQDLQLQQFVGPLPDQSVPLPEDRRRFFDRVEQARNRAGKQLTAAGPFIRKTQDWVGLAMKRLTAYALEKGFDRIEWTAGIQQAERWNKEIKKIKEIYWHPERHVLKAQLWDKPTLDHLSDSARPEDLDKHIGKDAAQRLRTGPEGEAGVTRPIPIQPEDEQELARQDQAFTAESERLKERAKALNTLATEARHQPVDPKLPMVEQDMEMVRTEHEAFEQRANAFMTELESLAPTAQVGRARLKRAFPGRREEIEATLNRYDQAFKQIKQQMAHLLNKDRHFPLEKSQAFTRELAENIDHIRKLDLKMSALKQERMNHPDLPGLEAEHLRLNLEASRLGEWLNAEFQYRQNSIRDAGRRVLADVQVAQRRLSQYMENATPQEAVEAAVDIMEASTERAIVPEMEAVARENLLLTVTDPERVRAIKEESRERVGDRVRPLEEAQDEAFERLQAIDRRQIGVITELADGTRVMPAKDLLIPDAGMRDFYDRILPSEARALIKKTLGKQAAQDVFVAPTNQAEAPDRTLYKAGAQMGFDLARLREKMVNENGLVEKFTLFQERQGPPRGSFQAVNVPHRELLSVIRLYQGADLSTLLHELGHHFFEVYRNMAAQPQAPAKIKSDMEALARFAGATDFSAWNAMSFEERRAGHEKVARAFEAYLFEGKAPSHNLRTLFRQFKAWLNKVYRSIQGLNVTLTPEVTAVFDRMLATEEEIEATARSRAMRPLFEQFDPEAMSEQEWGLYLEHFQQGEDAAKEKLTADALRNMKWLSRARSKIVRDMQREHRERRSVVEEEVTREVQERPVYQARAWLRQPVPERERLELVDGEFQKAEAEPQPKSDRNQVTPKADSVFTAIAKLGGLNKAEVVRRWGLDPAEKVPPGAFGKHVLRAQDKGLDIDDMGIRLAAEGYLSVDENGRYDDAEFEEKFFDELRGNKHFAITHDAFDPTEAWEAWYLENMAEDPQAADTQAKLSRPDLIALFGDAPDAAWKQLPTGKYGLVADDGLSPDVVARMFGFTGADELITQLVEAPPAKQVIQDETDRRMLERFGDLMTPEDIDREVTEALHGEMRMRVLQAEMRALSRMSRIPQELAAEARDFAKEQIGRMRTRDIQPNLFVNRGVREGREAEAAMKRGEIETAAAHKRAQIMNEFFAREAVRAKKRTETMVNYHNKFNSKDVRKRLDLVYLDQIDRVHEKYDFRKSVSDREIDRRQSFQQWLNEQRDMGFEPDVDTRLVEELERTHYRNLTFEELEALTRTVKSMEHLGRLKRRLLTDIEEREVETAAAEIIGSIVENTREPKKAPAIETRLPGEAAGQKVRAFFAGHRKLANWAREADGFKDNGITWQIFIRPLNERASWEAEERAEATARMAKIFDVYSFWELRKLYRAEHEPAIGMPITKLGRLVVALNMGNPVNRDRMQEAYGWDEQKLQEITAPLELKDWQTVQRIWDFVNSYWPMIEAKERRVNGTAPEKVEAQPVFTRFGVFPGGYYPIAFDDRQDMRAFADKMKEALEMTSRGAYSRNQTRRGHLKARVEGTVTRPVRLDLGPLFQHVNAVIHDLAFHEILIDTNRLLNHKDLSDTIKNRFGFEVRKMIGDNLNDVARGDTPARNMFEKAIDWLRKGVSIAFMAFSVSVGLLQPLGLFQSMARIGVAPVARGMVQAAGAVPRNLADVFAKIGPKWVARGLGKWMGSPAEIEGTMAWIYTRSAFMKNRAATINREIGEIRNRVLKTTLRRRALGPIEDNFFTLLVKFQLVADVPTWLGQYEKMMADPAMTEERAIELADQAVIDSQGTGLLHGLAQFQRGGPLMKTYTNFYSYFNVTYNLQADAWRRTKMHPTNPYEMGRLAGDTLLLLSLPVVFAWYMREALLKGDCDYGRDIDCVGEAMVREHLGYASGLLLGFREMGGAVMGWGYSGPAGNRFFSEATRLVQQAEQGEADEAFFRRLNATAGILFHYPSGQLEDFVEGYMAVEDGSAKSPFAPLVGVSHRE